MATLNSQTLHVNEERELAGRLAGVLFLTGGLTAVLLLFLPGVENDHWPWVVAVAAVCVVLALYGLFSSKAEQQGPWFWHLPSIASLLGVTGIMAATGGGDSPARFYLFFLLVYACYFYPERQARPYPLGCVAVALTPLLYHQAAIDDGYVAELIVVCPAYVILGGLIINGKAQLVELREHARALSLRDPLTELANRRAMLEWLQDHMDHSTAVGLMLVDLDGFKDVNTVHGFPAGDAVLRETARTLERSVRAEDVVARLGGDEFAVLAPAADGDAMRGLSERVLGAMRGMEGQRELDDLRLTASVGWVLYPTDADTIDGLIAAADLCLRAAKLTGKDRALSGADRSIAAA